jgi:hypothetical protein
MPDDIQTIAHYVAANLNDEPLRCVRDLAQHWKARGGRIGRNHVIAIVTSTSFRAARARQSDLSHRSWQVGRM